VVAFGLCLCRTLARFGVTVGGLAASFGGQDLRLLLSFGTQDRRLPFALRHEDGGALVALGFHLPRHGVDQVAWRLDILDLDAGDLDAPVVGRVVNDLEQAMIDLVALR